MATVNNNEVKVKNYEKNIELRVFGRAQKEWFGMFLSFLIFNNSFSLRLAFLRWAAN